jgi:preprotein translocase subunit YajC
VNLLFLFAILFVFMYLLLIRPQRQQQKRQLEMIQRLKPGDEVITAGGIYGDVREVMEDRVSLEISEDIEIEVAKQAIAQVIPPEAYETEAIEAPEETEDAYADEPEPAIAAQEENGKA